MATPNSEQTYLTTNQAAKYMGVTVETVHQLCTQQRLESAYQEPENGFWQIPTQSVDSWLQQQNQTTSTTFDQQEQQPNQQTNIVGDLNTGGGLNNTGEIHATNITGRDKITHGDEVHGPKITHIRQYVDPTDKTNQKNHNVLRQAVHIFWVQGVLHHSLYNKVRIRLGLSQRTDAVKTPWDLIWRQNNSRDKPINEQTQLIDIYEQMGERMLILGESGAGKTTTLLMLAEDLLQRAEDDPTLPTPVVFNLSSWAEGQPLDEWLVEELNQRYQMPKRVSQGWIERNELILLLDGLDEAAANRRDACVTAINNFQRRYVVSVVVCSRTVEYESLTDKLQLHGAVVVCPLTQSQIDNYIADLGIEGLNLRLALNNSDELRGLVNTPLMLSVMTLAYQDNEPQTENTNRSQVETLFDTYIQRMFQHRGKEQSPQYTHKQTLHWLQWLASQMVQRNQTLFLIEQLQPNWLGSTSQINLFSLSIGPFKLDSNIKAYENLNFSIKNGLMFGLISGLSVGLLGWLIFGLISGLFVGLLGWLIFGTVFGLYNLRSWQKIKNSWKEELRFGLIVGLILGLILGPMFRLYDLKSWQKAENLWKEILTVWLTAGLTVGAFVGTFIGLIKATIGGDRATEAKLKIQSNQGIWQSLKNGLSFCLIVGLISGLISKLFVGPLGWLTFGLGLGLSFGLLVGLSTCLKHFILRLLLYLQERTPSNYAHFLNYVAKRLLLRKVGGGYVFVHRMIMEHIAALTDEDIERIVGNVERR